MKITFCEILNKKRVDFKKKEKILNGIIYD